jgi:hypothetical protein
VKSLSHVCREYYSSIDVFVQNGLSHQGPDKRASGRNKVPLHMVRHVFPGTTSRLSRRRAQNRIYGLQISSVALSIGIVLVTLHLDAPYA